MIVRLPRPPEGSATVLVASFVNKLGSLGTSLVPVYIVERGLSSYQGSWILTLGRVATIVGTLGGGWASDRWGTRRTSLTAFLLSAIGFSALVLAPGWGWAAAAVVIAQLGAVGTNQSVRMLLMGSVRAGDQKRALAWIRSLNNLAQVAAFGLAAAAAPFGVAPLLVWDAVTSAAAWAWARARIPGIPPLAAPAPAPAPTTTTDAGATSARARGHWGWGPFLAVAFALAVWNGFYEMCIGGVAARLRLELGEAGLRLFSWTMILNTVACSALAIFAARWLRRSVPALIGGLLANGLGLVVAVRGAMISDAPLVFAGIALLTVGEITVGAVGQFSLIRLVPSRSRAGSAYSVGMLVALLGKFAVAPLIFPVAVEGRAVTNLAIGMGVAWLAATLAVLVCRRAIGEATE